jgi:hypothetical protein
MDPWNVINMCVLYVCMYEESILHGWPDASARALALETITHALYYKCCHNPCYNYFAVILWYQSL